MKILALGMNYVTETFLMVARALSEAFDWFQDLLEAIGLPWEIYLLVIIGFAVVGFVVTASFGQFRTSADSAITSTYTYARREFKEGNKKE